jgi:hypothetical protein
MNKHVVQLGGKGKEAQAHDETDEVIESYNRMLTSKLRVIR